MEEEAVEETVEETVEEETVDEVEASEALKGRRLKSKSNISPTPNPRNR